MTLAILFWVIMTVWLIFLIGSNWPPKGTFAATFVVWVVIAILGWQVFGPAIHK